MTRQSGYSVLEVLIAFAIMSLLLATLLPGQAKILSRATEGEENLLAHDVALSRLARLGHSEEILAGQTDFEDGPFRVQQDVRASSASSGRLQLFDVTVVVWNANGKELARVTTQRALEP